MVYNGSQVIEIDLAGTHLEDRYNLNALVGTGLLEKYGFIATNSHRSILSLPDISQLSHAEGAQILFKRRGERVLSARILARKDSFEKTRQSLLDLIEETRQKRQNGKKTN